MITQVRPPPAPVLRLDELPFTKNEVEVMRAEADGAAAAIAQVYDRLPPETQADCLKLAFALGKFNLRLTSLMRRG